MRGIYNEITTKNEVTYMKKLLCLCLAAILILMSGCQKTPDKPIVVKIGRNDPCPCGSGRKYKQCCGKNN